MSPPSSSRPSLPLFLQAWFVFDLLLVLLPPLHWWASGATPIFGLPRVLVYLLGTSIIVVASVIVAYQTTAGQPDREVR